MPQVRWPLLGGRPAVPIVLTPAGFQVESSWPAEVSLIRLSPEASITLPSAAAAMSAPLGLSGNSTPGELRSELPNVESSPTLDQRTIRMSLLTESEPTTTMRPEPSIAESRCAARCGSPAHGAGAGPVPETSHGAFETSNA